MSSKNSKKAVKFRGKQMLVVGLIALVLAAGYYRWTVGAIRSDAVSVSSTAAPSDTKADDSNNNDDKKDAATFWGGDSDKKDDNKNNDSDNNENKDNDNNNNDGGQENSASQSSGDIISRSKQERDSLRGETMDKWKEIASNKEASETTKKQAEENIVKMTKYSESENAIETNVKTKGFNDCFAQVSESGVSVIVKGGNLDSASVAQIKDIIIGETGVSASQIKISSEQ